MNYRSTRGNVKDALKSSDAVVQGLAPDGGLYVPVDFPKPAYDLEKLIQLPYQKLAQTILQWFLTTILQNSWLMAQPRPTLTNGMTIQSHH